MRTQFRRALLGLTLLLAGIGIDATAAQTQSYETGFNTMSRLSEELCSVLNTKVSKTLYARPVLLESMSQPYLQPTEYYDGTNRFRVVVMSAGLVEFLNSLAHAKAIESLERGYFQHYINYLCGQDLTTGPANFHVDGSPSHWGFNTMNQQMSRFNQMAGALLAINMAHHYLGHYQKYSVVLADPRNPVSIASVVTYSEWREAVSKGVKNALSCGLSVEGLKDFYDALDKMPVRPAWASAFLPRDVKIWKIKKDLDWLEGGFFLSEQ